ncbi:putative anion transporter 5 [Prunus yedoensis var. nudiflora]|uniref:Putative anion transporter 5 n=1 Tax=Prunus yedoensis var. nudiflora TaxID=2094558 RepID=A0A314YWK4_PRUYE|nr:putative anion transporter 5 [Prunus yedoensis var. nudiflora]
MMVLARLLLGVAQGFMFPSIHSVLAQWVPPHERYYVVCGLAQSELPKATTGFGEVLLLIKGGHEKIEVEDRDERNSNRTENIPWKSIFGSLPIWAIVVNNFTFHYALHVMMNWPPTYFEQGLQLSLQDMGSYKMVPYYLKMFIFSNIGGVTADHLITKRLLSVTATRKLLNTSGFIVASLALMTLPIFRTSLGAVICSYVAVNHMDIAPKYAGIVMGVSNTAGTLAGIIGVISLGSFLKLLSLLIRIFRMRKVGDQYS